MKKVGLFAILVLIPVNYFSLSFLPWKQGYYATYFTQYKNTWETYNFSIYKKLGNNKWIVLAIIKKPQTTFALALEAKENVNLSKSPFSLKLLKTYSLRGSEPGKSIAMHYFTKFMNIFNVRSMFLKKIKGKQKNAKLNKIKRFLGIKKVFLFTDPWPEFNYKIYHYCPKEMGKNIKSY